MSDKPSVKIIDSNESQNFLSSNKVLTENIDGKLFILEEPTALEYNDYINAAEDESKKIFTLIQNSVLMYIKSIDGVEFKKPQTVSEIRMGLTRLGKKSTLDKLTKYLKESGLMISDQNSEESKEELKK